MTDKVWWRVATIQDSGRSIQLNPVSITFIEEGPKGSWEGPSVVHFVGGTSVIVREGANNLY